MTYCQEHGITPHRFVADKKRIQEWDPLLGFHYLCKTCGYTRLYIAHDKNQQVPK